MDFATYLNWLLSEYDETEILELLQITAEELVEDYEDRIRRHYDEHFKEG